MREWLNETFIKEAFSDEELKRIPFVTVNPDKNPDFDTDPGNATKDRVFLLSITEANEYFSSDYSRNCKATDYAISKGAIMATADNNLLGTGWWLRTPGATRLAATRVTAGGEMPAENSVRAGISRISKPCLGVRPAIWVDLEF
ncbi:MAG: hypothetical protein IJ744_09490 [Lachnospiraceae bacterium]|nr:hypothetical protein [Lachnospiraceae bacterium]